MCGNVFDMCSEVCFEIRTPGNNTLVGTIKKVLSGPLQELLTDVDNFELIFPSDATPEDKLMLIGNVFMIDYSFFEDNGINQTQYLVVS